MKRLLKLPHGFPGWYAWLALVLSMFLSVGLSGVVSVRMSQRSVNAERAARVAQEQQAELQREDGRKVACILINAQVEVYRETPPPSATGKNAEQAWNDLSVLFHCK